MRNRNFNERYIFGGNKEAALSLTSIARRFAKRVAETASARGLMQFKDSLHCASAIITSSVIGNDVFTEVIAPLEEKTKSFQELATEEPLVIWIGDEQVGYIVSTLGPDFKIAKTEWYETSFEMFKKVPPALDADAYVGIVHFPDEENSHETLFDKYPVAIPLPVRAPSAGDIVRATNEQIFLYERMGGEVSFLHTPSKPTNKTLLFDRQEIIEKFELDHQSYSDRLRVYIGDIESDIIVEHGLKKSYSRKIFNNKSFSAKGQSFLSMGPAFREALWGTAGRREGSDPSLPMQPMWRMLPQTTPLVIADLEFSGISGARSFGLTSFVPNPYFFKNTDPVYMGADVLCSDGVTFELLWNLWLDDDETEFDSWNYVSYDSAKYGQSLIYSISTPAGRLRRIRGPVSYLRGELELQFRDDSKSYITTLEEGGDFSPFGIERRSLFGVVGDEIKRSLDEFDKYLFYDLSVLSYERLVDDAYWGMIEGAMVIEHMESSPHEEHLYAPYPWTGDASLRLVFSRVVWEKIAVELYATAFCRGRVSVFSGQSREKELNVYAAAKISGLRKDADVFGKNLETSFAESVETARLMQIDRFPDMAIDNDPSPAKGSLGMYKSAPKLFSTSGIFEPGSNNYAANIVAEKTWVMVKAVNEFRVASGVKSLSYSHALESAARSSAYEAFVSESPVNHTDAQGLKVLASSFQYGMRRISGVEVVSLRIFSTIDPAEAIRAISEDNEAKKILLWDTATEFGVSLSLPCPMFSWVSMPLWVVVFGSQY